jgi:pimeloyl-ACP methyl ester carboxylesterase
LLLSGEFDPVTPPRYGDEVARTLPQSRHFVLRGQGHGVLGVGCVPQLFAEFIERADAKRLDGSCLERLEYTPPFGGSYGWEP